MLVNECFRVTGGVGDMGFKFAGVVVKLSIAIKSSSVLRTLLSHEPIAIHT